VLTVNNTAGDQPLQDAGKIIQVIEIKNNDRNFRFLTNFNSRQVNHTQTTVNKFIVSDFINPLGFLVFCRVRCIDTVDFSRFENGIGTEFCSPNCSTSIGRYLRTACAT